MQERLKTTSTSPGHACPGQAHHSIGERQLQVCRCSGQMYWQTCWYSAVSPTRKQMTLAVMQCSVPVDLMIVSPFAANDQMLQAEDIACQT